MIYRFSNSTDCFFLCLPQEVQLSEWNQLVLCLGKPIIDYKTEQAGPIKEMSKNMVKLKQKN